MDSAASFDAKPCVFDPALLPEGGAIGQELADLFNDDESAGKLGENELILEHQPVSWLHRNVSREESGVRALSVRQPHAEAIIRGVKKIEYRTRATRIRERIYIYASLGRYSPGVEAEWMSKYGITDVRCEDLPRGVIIGTIELNDCTGSGRDYHWHMSNPERAKRLRKPKNHPQPSWFKPF